MKTHDRSQGGGVQVDVMDSRARGADGAHPRGSEAIREVRRTTLTALLAGASELVIDFAGREYRLRVTQNGKLILTA